MRYLIALIFSLFILPAHAQFQTWHYHDGGCNATGSSGACYTPTGSIQFVVVTNNDSTNAVACAIGGVAAALNTDTSVTLASGSSYTWFFPNGLPLPAGAVNCISAGTSSPIHYDIVSNP